MNLQTWKTALRQHYTAPLSETFKQFRLGTMLFFFGGVLLYIALNNLAPSIQQEITVLLGMTIGGLGFLIAMLAQVRMVISRIVQFFEE